MRKQPTAHTARADSTLDAVAAALDSAVGIYVELDLAGAGEASPGKWAQLSRAAAVLLRQARRGYASAAGAGEPRALSAQPSLWS